MVMMGFRLLVKVLFKSAISNFNQSLIEPFLAATRFIASDEENGRTIGVEGEGDAPDPVTGAEPQFFHVGMGGTVEGVYMGVRIFAKSSSLAAVGSCKNSGKKSS
jgi:hypothetical protein